MSQHHDPVHPDSGHLTPEVMADLQLGLLDSESAAHAEQHLAHCEECSAVWRDLATLTDALADLPDAPMPADVWQDLAAAIAAEPVTTPAGSATVVPLDSGRKRRWGRPGIGLVAGAAGVALIGAIGYSALQGPGNEATTASDSGGAASATKDVVEVPVAAYRATASGTKYQEAALDSQVTKLVSAAGATASQEWIDTSSAPTTTPSVTESAGTPTTTATPTQTSDLGRGQGAMATDPSVAKACIQGYLGVAGVPPLAIDIGIWKGEPAAIIVLPSADDPTKAEVWVIDPDCSGPDGQLFYYATVTR